MALFGSKSTLSDIVNGRRLPRKAHLYVILRRCGVTDDAVLSAWEDARRAVETLERVSTLPNVLSAREEELGEKISELQSTVESLTSSEHTLREELARERAKAESLEQELRRLRGEYRPTGDPNDRIAELEALLKRERALVDQLRTELQRIVRERRHAEVTIELLLAERHDTQVAISLEDAADLQFTRAEYERREKEDAARELGKLRREVAELRDLLTTYQAAQHDERQTTSAAPLPLPEPRRGWWRRLMGR